MINASVDEVKTGTQGIGNRLWGAGGAHFLARNVQGFRRLYLGFGDLVPRNNGEQRKLVCEGIHFTEGNEVRFREVLIDFEDKFPRQLG